MAAMIPSPSLVARQSELQLLLMDYKAENSFTLKLVREKMAADDKSKVLTAEYSSLTYIEKRMMREDAVAQEVAHGCENEESETFELNDLFLLD
ncbi:hypothetical protein Tco_0993762 [Tanacetum coccineum]